MTPPRTPDSAVLPCFHGCLAFLNRHFPPRTTPRPPHPLGQPLRSQQQPRGLGLLHSPSTPAPATAPSGRPAFLPRVCPDCLILIPFRLPQISFSALRLKHFSTLRQLPRCGDQTPASVPSPADGRSSPANTPVSPYFLCPTEFCVVL